MCFWGSWTQCQMSKCQKRAKCPKMECKNCEIIFLLKWILIYKFCEKNYLPLDILSILTFRRFDIPVFDISSFLTFQHLTFRLSKLCLRTVFGG